MQFRCQSGRKFLHSGARFFRDQIPWPAIQISGRPRA